MPDRDALEEARGRAVKFLSTVLYGDWPDEPMQRTHRRAVLAIEEIFRSQWEAAEREHGRSGTPFARWNIQRTEEGIETCDGAHPRGDSCHWVPWVRVAAERERTLAMLGEALAVMARRGACWDSVWEDGKRVGDVMFWLAENNRNSITPDEHQYPVTTADLLAAIEARRQTPEGETT